MAEKHFEFFEAGEKVWTRSLEGEYRPISLLMRHGIGTGPFSVHAVEDADPGTLARSLHPQLVFLVDDEGDPVSVHGVESSLSAFWFTKENLSGAFDKEFTNSEKEELADFIDKAQGIARDALNANHDLQNVLDQAQARGFNLGFTLYTAVGRRDEGNNEKEETQKLHVENGAVLPGTFTEADSKNFKEFFNIKLDDEIN